MTSNEILTCRDKSINNINLERREHGAEEEKERRGAPDNTLRGRLVITTSEERERE